jgi:hypothetical protein
MTEPLHEVHFLTLTVLLSRRGWIAPVELPRGSQQQGTHLIPLDKGFRLFPQYRVEFARCLAGGGYLSDAGTLDLQPDGTLKARIAGQEIRFRLRLLRPLGGQPVVFEYVGRLTHPDFMLPLAEIVPDDEGQLADLYARERITIVGYDPMTSYGGVDTLAPPGPARVG